MVSILIPAYNSENFIRETITSCINQTYKDLEIIIVDDGSEDNTYKIAKAYEADGRIRVYSQRNQGACHARNHAFEKCHGDYVVYLDADDIISPNFVQNHIEVLQNSNCNDVSFCPWDRFYSNFCEAKFPHLGIYKDYQDAFQLLLDMWNEGSMLQTSCYMSPRQLIVKSGGWDENVLKNQDGEFFSRILLLAKKAYFIPEAKVYYRTGDYLTVSKASSEKKVASMLDTFISYKINALAHEDSRRVREALSVNFTLFIYLYGNQYPSLYEPARQEIKSLGVGYVLKCEPDRVKLLCKLVGFELFLKIRKLLYRR